MRLHLINAPSLVGKDYGALGKQLFTPLGILYLASYVRSQLPDVQIKITDGLLTGHDKCLKEVTDFDPQVIGISCNTPTSTGAYALSGELKRLNPNVLILIGGVHATAMPEDAATRSQADLIAVGEGEVILTEVLKRYQQLETIRKENYQDIPGLVFKKDDTICRTGLMPLISDLDTIPFPARDLVNLGDYTGWPVAQQAPETTIISSRGCPFYCHFCSNPVWKLQKPWLRVRSAKNIVDEIEELVNKHGIKEYFDQCDEFNHNLRWAIEVCDEKNRRGLDIPWKVCLRADKINERFAKALADSNCWYVHVGIETGNQETLSGIGKKISLDQVVEGCKLLKKYNIEIMGLFMFFNAWEGKSGLEYEDAEKAGNTLRFARRLIHDGLIDYISWAQATAYPGSKLWDTAVKYNLIPVKDMGKWENWTHVFKFTLDLPTVSNVQKIRLKFLGSLVQAWCMLRSPRVNRKKAYYERLLGLIGLVRDTLFKNIFRKL